MRLLSLLFGLLFCSLCFSGNALSLQLLYPDDGTFVVKSRYLVVKGGRDPLPDGFSIEINGVKSDIIDVTSAQYRDLFADMLIVEPIFDPGENRIVVEAYLNQEVVSKVDATIYYLESFDGIPPEGFKKELFHFDDREALCAECHVMNPTREQMLNPDPRLNACGACHSRMLGKAHVHGPAGVFECVYCHDSTSQPNKYQPRPGDAEICLECHEDIVAGFKRSKFIHGPVDAGSCLVCHDSHASDNIAQLVASTNRLCLSCHDSVVKDVHVLRGIGGKAHPLDGVPDPSKLNRELSCVGCHNPHSGNASSLFVRGIENKMDLCQVCHKK